MPRKIKIIISDEIKLDKFSIDGEISFAEVKSLYKLDIDGIKILVSKLNEELNNQIKKIYPNYEENNNC